MKDLEKLKVPARSTSEGLSLLEREAIPVGMYWGLTQKRIRAYQWMKRGGFFNRLQGSPLGYKKVWHRGVRIQPPLFVTQYGPRWAYFHPRSGS